MASYVNRKQTGVSGVGDWIPLNRWSKDDYSIVISNAGGATYTVEGTIDQINREGVLGSETAFAIVNLEDVSGNRSDNIAETPLEAIRINLSVGTADFHVMQQGD